MATRDEAARLDDAPRTDVVDGAETADEGDVTSIALAAFFVGLIALVGVLLLVSALP